MAPLRPLFLPIAALLTTLPATALAAHLPVTGLLRANGGGPVADGSYILFVGVYPQKDAPKSAWEAVVKNVAVQQGGFALELGDPMTPALPDALFQSGTPLWLGVAVGNDPELPRVPLRMVPGAHFAQIAAGLECSACVTETALGAGAVTSAKVAFAYAGASEKGGPATLALSAKQAEVAQVAKAAETAAKADEASMAAAASKLACTGCVDLAHLAKGAQDAFVSSKGGKLDGALEVTGKATVGGGLDLGKSTITGGKFAALDVAKAACTPDNAGQIALDTTTARLHFCDAKAWLRLRTCSAACKKPEEIPCGAALVDDCGEAGACKGTGVLCASGGTCEDGKCKIALPGTTQFNAVKDCKALQKAYPEAPLGKYWIDPEGTGAYEAVCDVKTDGGGWVKLLEKAERYGNAQKAHKALAGGTFSEMRAVHVSGFVACNCSYSGDGAAHPWQACNPSHGDVYSWELMKNGGYVVKQSDWGTLPSQCPKPANGKADLKCTVNWTAKKGDDLVPTWQEPSNNTSLGDNCGTQVIDLWAR